MPKYLELTPGLFSNTKQKEKLFGSFLLPLTSITAWELIDDTVNVYEDNSKVFVVVVVGSHPLPMLW